MTQNIQVDSLCGIGKLQVVKRQHHLNYIYKDKKIRHENAKGDSVQESTHVGIIAEQNNSPTNHNFTCFKRQKVLLTSESFYITADYLLHNAVLLFGMNEELLSTMETCITHFATNFLSHSVI